MKKYTRDTDRPGRENPHRLSWNWVQAEGDKKGSKGRGKTADTGTWRRAKGAETIGRSWCGGLVVETVKLDVVLLRERRWGSGKTENATTTNGYRWGAVWWRKEKKITIQKHLIWVGRVGMQLLLIIIDGA